MEWSEFLSWAVGAGVSVIVGFLLSVIAEYVPTFQTLDRKWKRLAMLGLCVAVPLFVSVIGIWTAGWPHTWEGTFWPALQAGWLAFASSQVAHLRKM